MSKKHTHFEADFSDGTTYIQGIKDESIDTEGKNAFFDILQRMDQVIRFHIIKDTGDRYTVDLRDGHFEINGCPFDAHEQYFDTRGKTLQLIYFKEMRRDDTVTGTVQEDLSIKQATTPGVPYVNRYFIGWQTNKPNGDSVQQTIAVG